MPGIMDPMNRFLVHASVALAALAILTPATASGARWGVRVSPASGSPETVFVVSFRNAIRGDGRYLVTARPRNSADGCVGSFAVRVSGHRRHLRVSLDPGKLGGSWCPGTYRGRIRALRMRCARRCHRFVRTVGRFALHVRDGEPPPKPLPPWHPPPKPPPADTTPPAFEGLQSAISCQAGPAHYDTVPVVLTWTAATDDATPSWQIVYDVFVAHSPGGEDFSQPTWTTLPGVIMFATPPLPTSGIYLVVRARDQAGNEDGNTVERQPVSPCV